MDAHQTAQRIPTEVKNVLASLNEQNHESVIQDLTQYFDNGPEESIPVVATCLDHFGIHKDDLGSTNQLEPTIAKLFRNLMRKPHFSLTFSGLMRDRSVSEDFLDNLSTALKLSIGEKVGFGLTLLDSENDDTKIEGRKFCISQCEELCDNDITLDTDAGEVLDVLSNLEQSEVLSRHVDSFKAIILEVWLNANCRFILADKVPNVKLLSRTDFQIVDPTEMSAETSASRFAKMLGSWNQLSYHCGGLRADGFQLSADATFSLLMACYRNICQDPFPLAAVCGNVWEIPESQLLFLKQAVSSRPEVFTFAHCKRQMEYVDHKYQRHHAIQPWLCLDLLEVLCLLAEKGHANSVKSMMEFPLANFPEVVLLGMAHVITSGNLLQHEVSISVLPMLLKDSSKSGTILRLWDVNPLLLSRALKSFLVLDLENMSRVVDLFQDLEILSSVLDLVPMPLGIKLASLASTKEFLDLEEWLGINLSESEDIFVEECLRFLTEVEENSGDIWNIYKETVPIFSKVLQSHADLVASNKLSKQMESLNVTTCTQRGPVLENNDDPEPSTSDKFADQINAKMQNSSSHYTGSILEDQSSALKTHLLSLLPAAMHKAIDELLATTVNRSVSISTQTAIELALKDYINDPDEDSIYNTSSFMVTSLAGSLSYITCKEPLRNLMSTHLRNSVKGLNFAGEFLEDTMKRVVDENLHLGCASVERDATEKGLLIVKREINLQLSIRKKQKEGPERFVSKTIEPSYTTDVAMNKIQVLLSKLEGLIANDATADQIQYAAAEVRAVILKCIRKDETALVVAQQVFEGLYKNVSNTASIDSRLTVLTIICGVNELVQKELTGWVLTADDKKFNKDITVGLISRQLLNLAEYSTHMAWLITAGKSATAIEFALSLVKTLETIDARVLSELGSIVDALSKVTYLPVARNDDNLALISSEPDPLPGLVSMLFSEWCRIHALHGVNDAVYAYFVQDVYQNVLARSDDMLNRFFYILLDLVVSHYRAVEVNASHMQYYQQGEASSFLAIDICTDLIFSVLKFHPVNNMTNKLSLLLKVLAVIVEVIKKDADERKTAFDPKPYFRIFTNIFNHINSVNSVLVGADLQVLASIAHSFHALQPAKLPEFCFTWLELVTRQDFMPKLLSQDDHEGWKYFKCLLIDLLRFMEPLLRSGELTEPVRALYSGTVRMMMVLSHDFPEFICYYYSDLCDLIPPHCIELRSIIQNALSHNMTPGLEYRPT